MRSTKIKIKCSSSLWICSHHMVILISENKITDFLLILAWPSPLKRFEEKGADSDRNLFALPSTLIRWGVKLSFCLYSQLRNGDFKHLWVYSQCQCQCFQFRAMLMQFSVLNGEKLPWPHPFWIWHALPYININQWLKTHPSNYT